MPRSLYVSVSQAIDTQLVSDLTRSEYMVLRFINERTLRYQKEWEFIPMRHFLNGVFSGEGKRVHAGLPYAKATIIKAYQSLIEKGFLAKEDGTRNKFMIDYEHLLEVAGNMSLAITGLKKSRQGKTGTVTKGTTTPHQTVTKRPSPSIKEQKIQSTGYPDASAPDSPEEEGETLESVLQETIDAGRNRMRQRANKVSTNITMSNVKAAWTQANLKHRKGRVIASITRKELGRLRKAFHTNTIPIGLNEFLDWAVENWNSIGGKEMKWVKDFPATPDIGFFSTMFKHFVQAYGEFYDRQWERQEELRTAKQKGGSRSQKEIVEEALRLKRLLDVREKELERERRENKLRRAGDIHKALSRKSCDTGYRRERKTEMREIEDLEIAPRIPV